MGMIGEFLWSMMICLVLVRIAGGAMKILSGIRRDKAKAMEEEMNKEASIQKEEIDKAAAIEMVEDIHCGTFVPKHKAFQVVEEEKIHYFCSWECRQNYIDSKKQQYPH